jgi:hypothetical protein
MKHEITYTEHYAIIVIDEQARESDWGYIPFQGGEVKLVGRFFADDWKKVIAHRPLNDAHIIEGVPLLPQFSQEEEVEIPFPNNEKYIRDGDEMITWMRGWEKGFKGAKETYEFTLDDMKECWNKAYMEGMSLDDEIHDTLFFDKFIQSRRVKRPMYFEMETIPMNLDEIREKGKGFLNSIIYKPKTKTNTQGQIEVKGKYIYG